VNRSIILNISSVWQLLWVSWPQLCYSTAYCVQKYR